MGHYVQPGWAPINFTPKIEHKSVNAPLTHRANVSEAAFAPVNFSPDPSKTGASDEVRTEARNYIQPDHRNSEVHHHRVGVTQSPEVSPYVQPGTEFFGTGYDAGTCTTSCPACGALAFPIGSSDFRFLCKQCHAQFSLQNLLNAIEFLNSPGIKGVQVRTEPGTMAFAIENS
jgi:hypothetical protein